MKFNGILTAVSWLIGTFCFAYFVGGNIPYFIFYVSLVLVLISFLWSKFITRVTAQCYMETITAQVGSKLKVTLEVKNNSGWPIPWGQVWVELPKTFCIPDDLACYTFSLGPNERKTINDIMECKVRGRFAWGNILIKTGDIFGIFNNLIPAGESKELIVMPEVIDLGDQLRNLNGQNFVGNPSSLRQGRGGSSFLGVRKYDSGDGIARIHWKASARTQSLLVKQFQEQKTARFNIFLDLCNASHAGEGPEGSFEKALTLAASLAALGVKIGAGFGLITYGVGKNIIPIGYGKNHFNLILEALVEVNAGETQEPLAVNDTFSLLDRNCYSFILSGKIDEKAIDDIIWLKEQGQGTTVFLMALETFSEKGFENELKERENLISRLVANGLSVMVIEKSTDLRLLLRGL